MLLLGKIGAGQAGAVLVVDDKGEVAKEGVVVLVGRGVEVEVRGVEGQRLDSAVLAAQVSDLTGLGSRSIALDFSACLVGVQVRQRLGAVAVLGDGLAMEMVG